MLIYGLNLVVIGTLCFTIYHTNLKKIHVLRLSLIYLFLISSFRDQMIGTDYPGYIELFYQIIRIGHAYVENGYVFLNKIVAFFTDQYIGLAIAINLLLFIPLYFYIKNCVSPRYWGLCIFIFAANPYMFIQTTFNALRQACATGIVLIGMNALMHRKKSIMPIVFYYLTILIAGQFHRLSYILAIIPVVLSIKWKKKYWYVFTVAAVAVNVVGARIIAMVMARLLHFSRRYLNYEASMLNNPIYILFVVLVIFYLLSHYNAYTAMGYKKKRLIDFYLFSLCFLIMALPNDMFYRVYMVLAFCALPGVATVCEGTLPGFSRIRFRHEKLIVERLYVLYYFFFYVGYIALLAINQNDSYVPFRFFFEA